MTNSTKGPVRLDEWRRRHLKGYPHKILQDVEIEAFVNSVLLTMTFGGIARACVEKFGAARAPSPSSVHRYWSAFFRPSQPEIHRQKRRRKPRERSAQPEETLK